MGLRWDAARTGCSGTPHWIRGGEVVDGPTVCSEPASYYLGYQYTNERMRKEIEAAALWMEFELVSDDREQFDMMTEDIEAGGAVPWYQGCSELGPRALDHRNKLADPR